jgi:hypothetical protein
MKFKFKIVILNFERKILDFSMIHVLYFVFQLYQ